MPELPEIETIRRDLIQFVLSATIQRVEVLDPTVICELPPATFSQSVQGTTITNVQRYGKYLILTLTRPCGSASPQAGEARESYPLSPPGERVRVRGEQFLIVHLRMTGQLLLGTPSEQPPTNPTPRLIVTFADGRSLYFRDQRRFGKIFLARDWHTVPPLARLGPEPLPIGSDGVRRKPDLKDGCDRDKFAELLRRHTGAIKPLLMNQTIIAGVGNIYAQEALFRAGIKPMRKAHRIRAYEVTHLWAALQATLRSAIRRRGSSQNTYRDLLGRPGRAQRFHAVYRRAGQPCPRCETPLVGLKVSGRSSVFCRYCQH